MEDDYLLDEDDDDYTVPLEIKNVSDVDEESQEDDPIEEDTSGPSKLDVYTGRLSKDELWLLTAYDDVRKSEEIEEAATIIVSANPQHTSANTVSNIVKDMFHKQGHSRMQNTKFTPDSLMRGEDVYAEIEEDDDNSFNSTYSKEAKEQIDRFISYLSTRDLSEDSIVSQRRKQRQIPAFIIFLFSSGMFDLILACPSMPKVYQDQIDNALKKITKEKYQILEELAKHYESVGRNKVAEKVRELGLAWFYREPAEIKYAAEYRDLNLTSEDINIYREYRGRFTNTSTAITQDVISDLIEVVIDPQKGIYEKLKDKTRSEAITDVKKEYKRWTDQEDPGQSELASKIIFKEL